MSLETVATICEKTGGRALLGKVLRWSGLLCLNYHRIGDGRRSPFDRGLWSSDEATFDSHLRFLKATLDLIAPDDLPIVVARSTGRYAMITFDDGYVDNYHAAFPILKHHHAPATFFVCTGFIDKPRVPWWDEIAWMVRAGKGGAVALRGWRPTPVVFDEPEREQAIRAVLRVYKTLPPERTEAFLDHVAAETGSGRFSGGGSDLWMTWDMLREMQAAGMSIGGHTVNHPVLATMRADEQGNEIDGCAQRLQEELGIPMRFFSFPVGGRRAFDATTQALLRHVGVQFAFSYYGGFRRFDQWDDLDIRRVPVESDTSRARFRAIVAAPSIFARMGAP